jgi:hypothetical protein
MFSCREYLDLQARTQAHPDACLKKVGRLWAGPASKIDEIAAAIDSELAAEPEGRLERLGAAEVNRRFPQVREPVARPGTHSRSASPTCAHPPEHTHPD